MSRLQKFIQHQELLATHAAASTMQAESKRQVHEQKRPVQPTPQEVASHNLVHEPFQEWCEICVQFRARLDKHAVSDGTRTSTSLISFDFGLASIEQQIQMIV